MQPSILLKAALSALWLSIIVGTTMAYTLEAKLPAPLISAMNDYPYHQHAKYLCIFLLVILAFASFALLQRKNYARISFVVTSILLCIPAYLAGPYAQYKPAQMIEYLTLTLIGIIIGMIFCPPINKLYQPAKESLFNLATTWKVRTLALILIIITLSVLLNNSELPKVFQTFKSPDIINLRLSILLCGTYMTSLCLLIFRLNIAKYAFVISAMLIQLLYSDGTADTELNHVFDILESYTFGALLVALFCKPANQEFVWIPRWTKTIFKSAFSRAWKGELPLWHAYFYIYLLPHMLIHNILKLSVHFLHFTKLFMAVESLFFPYFFYAAICVWRCSKNSLHIWRFITRTAVAVQTIILFIFLMIIII